MYTTFEDFCLDVYDDIHILYLVSDSQRLSFSQELTSNLMLGLSLGLGLAWGHFEDKKFFINTTFKYFWPDVYDDIYVLYLVWDFERL